jgi:hypothetical protein
MVRIDDDLAGYWFDSADRFRVADAGEQNSCRRERSEGRSEVCYVQARHDLLERMNELPQKFNASRLLGDRCLQNLDGEGICRGSDHLQIPHGVL